MNQHDHGKHHHEQHHSNKKRGIHQDWRVWVAVVLMLGAMAMYVLSFDEEFQPGEDGPAQPVEAMP